MQKTALKSTQYSKYNTILNIGKMASMQVIQFIKLFNAKNCS